MKKFETNKQPYGPELDPEIANQMLENIFEACQVERNSVPLEVLTAYSNYRKERYALQRLIIIIVLILWILIPMLFISPKFDVVEKYANTGMPKYEIYVHTLLPITKVNAVMNDKNISIYEMNPHNFSLQPTQNGAMTLTVTLFNKQMSSQDIMVSDYDDANPKLVSNDVTAETLTFYVEDEESGIDYEYIHAETASGTEVTPLSYDEQKGEIVFAYPSEALNVYIPDMVGNNLHLRITVDPE